MAEPALAAAPPIEPRPPAVRRLGVRRWLPEAAIFALLFLSFQLNPHHLRTDYGDGGGRWPDRVDSFSDQLVANKVRNDAWGTAALHTRFLVFTRGYDAFDYSYYPEGVYAYRSAFALQGSVFSTLRPLLGIRGDRSMERYFLFLRIVMAAGLAAVLTLYVGRLRREQGDAAALVAGVVLASGAGLVMFAQNLYFAVPILLLPFALVTRGYGAWPLRTLLLAVLGGSALNFLCRYEFATTVALLAVAPIFAFRRDEPLRAKLRPAAAVFVAVIGGFAIAIAIHVLWNAFELGSLRAGLDALAKRIGERNLSSIGVPAPLSADMWSMLSWRSTFLAMALPFAGATLSQKTVLVLFCAAPFAVRPFDLRAVALWAVTGFSYVSWYVFGYQHVMWHHPYDWLLFSLGIVLGLATLLAWSVARLGRDAVVALVAVLAVAIVARVVERPPRPPAPAALAAPAGERARVVAEAVEGRGWQHGILRRNGEASLLRLASGSAAGIAPGTKLFFAATGAVTVKDVGPGEGGCVYVRVDRNLWPARDGYPNPIAVY